MKSDHFPHISQLSHIEVTVSSLSNKEDNSYRQLSHTDKVYSKMKSIKCNASNKNI